MDTIIENVVSPLLDVVTNDVIGSAVGVLSSVLLADPDTENAEHTSDRLADDVTGNIALADSSAQIPNSSIMHSNSTPLIGASTTESIAEMSNMSDRWFFYHAVPFTATSKLYDVITNINYPAGLFGSANLAIYNLMEFFRFFHFDVTIKVQVNPTMFNSGCFKVIYYPESRGAVHEPKLNYRTANNVPGCEVNVCAANSGEFVIPYNNVNRMFDNDNEVVGNIAIFVWSPLQGVDGASSNLDIQVYFKVSNLKMIGMSVPRSPFTTDQDDSLRRRLKNLRVSDPQKLAAILDSFEENSSGVKNFAKTNITFANWRQSTNPVRDLSFDGETRTPIVDVVGGHDLDMKTIVAIPSVIKDIDWSVTHAPDSLLMAFPVHPILMPWKWDATAKTDYFAPTNLAQFAVLYRYWRGIIKVTFQVFPSVVHKGRLIAVFAPGVFDKAPSFDSLKSCRQVQYDLTSLATEFSIDIPFLSNTDYKDVHGLDKIADWWSLTPSNVQYSCGSLYLFVQIPLSGSDTVATSINVKTLISAPSISFHFPYAPFNPRNKPFRYSTIQFPEPFEANGSLATDSTQAQTTSFAAQPHFQPPPVSLPVDDSMPPSFMNDHMSIPKLLTRPTIFTNIHFNNVATSIWSENISLGGRRGGLVTVGRSVLDSCGYMSGSVLLHVFLSEEGGLTMTEGNNHLLYIAFCPPDGDASSFNDVNTFVQNGCAVMNYPQEFTSTFRIPYYRHCNAVKPIDNLCQVHFLYLGNGHDGAGLKVRVYYNMTEDVRLNFLTMNRLWSFKPSASDDEEEDDGEGTSTQLCKFNEGRSPVGSPDCSST